MLRASVCAADMLCDISIKDVNVLVCAFCLVFLDVFLVWVCATKANVICSYWRVTFCI